jgi:hypothetical protein
MPRRRWREMAARPACVTATAERLEAVQVAAEMARDDSTPSTCGCAGRATGGGVCGGGVARDDSTPSTCTCGGAGQATGGGVCGGGSGVRRQHAEHAWLRQLSDRRRRMRLRRWREMAARRAHMAATAKRMEAAYAAEEMARDDSTPSTRTRGCAGQATGGGVCGGGDGER